MDSSRDRLIITDSGTYIQSYIQWIPTLVTPLFKRLSFKRQLCQVLNFFRFFLNVKKPLFKKPLLKGYSDLRDKFLKISLVSGKILGKIFYSKIILKKKFLLNWLNISYVLNIIAD